MICYLFNIYLFHKKHSLFNSFLSLSNSDNYTYPCIVYLTSDDDVTLVGTQLNTLPSESESTYPDVVFSWHESYGTTL